MHDNNAPFTLSFPCLLAGGSAQWIAVLPDPLGSSHPATLSSACKKATLLTSLPLHSVADATRAGHRQANDACTQLFVADKF